MDYITRNRNGRNVKAVCNAMSVSEAGYYKHLRKKPSPPKHAKLLAQIYEILNEEPENANYGVRRIYKALRLKKGYTGSYGTVYRVCKENNLMIKRRFKPNGITKADSEARKAVNSRADCSDRRYSNAEPFKA